MTPVMKHNNKICFREIKSIAMSLSNEYNMNAFIANAPGTVEYEDWLGNTGTLVVQAGVVYPISIKKWTGGTADGIYALS